MMRIVVGGQLGKEEIKACVEGLKIQNLSVAVKDDMSATMDLKSGAADYYLGACLTGGGGALAMPIAMMGYASCKALGSADAEVIAKALDAGVRAFGFTPQMIRQIVPPLVEEMAKRA